MIYLFLIAVLIIGFLVFAMFMILKNTVNRINNQTKSYFVDKLQEYDHLIDEKEEKLNRVDEELKKRESQIFKEETNKSQKNYEFDYNIIELFSKTKYQDKNIFEITKKIDEKFNLDYNSILNKFIANVETNDIVYNFCINLKQKFTGEIIYQIKILDDKEEYLKKFLDNNEYKIYEAFKTLNNNTDIDSFMDYLDELIDLNNPTILVYVGNKEENYDHLSKYIKTKFAPDIYRGIRIIYKNKMYDFSLSERNV